ncbi:hypothetical protein [Eubacterium sp.]|uniref:hypothetical protein n=1 Tax=Eubacterium sp. TaxID=142586 RepID=UPI0025846CD7|nr:hypothetical protein [Eubacterium sp.]MCR5368426.1 hypothetical protein [Eubacterium sp.]
MKFFRRRKKGYSFADDLICSDSIISFVSSGIALVLIISIIVLATVKNGKTPDFTGTLFIISGILTINGLFFGATSFKQDAGSNNTKRVSVWLAVLNLVILFVLWFI